MYKPVVTCFYSRFPPCCILSLTVRKTLALFIYLLTSSIHLHRPWTNILGCHLPEGLFTPGAARVNNAGNCRLVRVIYLRIL